METYAQLRPTTDEKPLRDLQFMLQATPAVLVAYELGLFTQVEGKTMTPEQVAEAMGLSPRAAQAVLSVCASVGFVERADDGYCLTAYGREYLVPSSAVSHLGTLDNLLGRAKTGRDSFEKIRDAILTDKPQQHWGEDIFNYSTPEAIERGEAQRIVNTFHSNSLAPSTVWPHHIDLSRHTTILDIGGASGAHAMGAAANWSNLTGLVLDLEPVCRAAEPVIARHGMTDRVRTYPADMFNDPYPEADVHFYSNILHDWPPERGSYLLRKSFDALPADGLTILHEMVFNDDKTGPAGVSGRNLQMLTGMLGQQFSGPELSAMLSDAGFANVTTTPTFAYYSIVVGQKPG